MSVRLDLVASCVESKLQVIELLVNTQLLEFHPFSPNGEKIMLMF